MASPQFFQDTSMFRPEFSHREASPFLQANPAATHRPVLARFSSTISFATCPRAECSYHEGKSSSENSRKQLSSSLYSRVTFSLRRQFLFAERLWLDARKDARRMQEGRSVVPCATIVSHQHITLTHQPPTITTITSHRHIKYPTNCRIFLWLYLS